MNEPVISQVTFFPLRPTEKGLIGIASCLFNNQLSLNSISVYSTLSGDIRLLFPDKVLPNSKRINIYYPVNKHVYEAIKDAVDSKLRELAKKVENKAD